MTWRRGVGLAALATLIGLAAVALWSLPEVARREAAARLLAATGRPVSIEDVDLNLFTGRVAFKGFRIGERETSDTFLEFERLDARVAPLALAFRHLHLREISLTGATVRVARTGPTQFNFSDLLALIPPAEAPQQSKWTITVDRVGLARGSILATDRTLSPPREWRLAGLTIGAGGLTTGQPTGPGQVALQAKVGDMALAMDTQSVRLTPGLLTFRVSLEGLDMSQFHPYLPPDLPVFPRNGKVGLTLVVALERAPGELKQLVISGDVRVDGLTLTRADEPAPFATVSNVSVGIKAADLLTRAVTLGTVELEGLDLRVRRDRDGAVDLLRGLVHARAAAAPPPAAPSPASHPPLRLGIEQVKLDAGTITFLDESISPAREWRIREASLDAKGLSASPDQATGRLALRARVAADAASESATVVIGADAVRWAPLAARVQASVDGLELAQVGPYLPPGLPVLPPSGRLKADVTLDLERHGSELRRALLSGEGQVTGLVLTRAPGETPFATATRLGVGVKQADLVGRTAALTSLEASGLDLRLRRGADGRIDLLEPFEAHPARSETRPARAPSADGRAGAPSGRAAATAPFQLQIERVGIGDSAVTVVDEMVSPPREWRIQDLALQARDVTTVPGQTGGPAEIRARIAGSPDGGDTAISVEADSLRLFPLASSLRASVEGLDLAQIGPYLPAGFPVSPPVGRADVKLTLDLEGGPDGLRRARASGTATVAGLTLTQTGRRAPFATVPQLTVAIKQADLVARSATLSSVEANGLEIRARRDAQGRIDLRGLLELRAALPAAQPLKVGAPAGGEKARAEAGAAFRLEVEHVGVGAGVGTFHDEAVSPPREWKIRDLSMEARGVTTAPGKAFGPVSLRARLSEGLSRTNGVDIAVAASAVRLSPLAASLRASVDGLELGALGPYLPAGLPVLPQRGIAHATMALDLERGPDGLRRALASGQATVTALTLSEPGGQAPLATIRRLAVALNGADLVARTARVGSLEAQGLDLLARRDATGQIDLVALATRSGPGAHATAGRTGATTRGRHEWQVIVERLALTKAAAAFEDEAVSPRVTLALTDMALTMDGISWPSTGPGQLEFSAGLPGGGRLEIKGSAMLRPFEADVYMTMRDAPIDPYQPYFPFRARLSGRFSGDSRSQFKLEDGKIVAASQGTGWTENLEVRDPDSATPVIRGERLEFRSVDFGWPNYARVARVTMRRPVVRVERMPDGTINLHRLFAPSRGPASPGPSGGRDGKASEPRKEAASLYETMLIDFGEILVEDGVARFIDRTTRPAFSQDVSGLALRVREVSNTPGQQARVTARGLIGGKATLELAGHISPLASEFHADLVGVLRDFPLASVNPYVEGRFGWVVRGGALDARLHYRLDEGRLTGTTDAVVRGLRVAPSGSSAEVEKRVGLPLKTIVGLMKDQGGEFRVTVPVHGTLRERQFDWGNVVWTAVQNSLVNVVAAPFKLVGRLFTGGAASEASVAIEPVTFTPGSAAILPAMEDELLRAADFLRGSPGAGLTLVPVATRQDLEALKAEELTVRIERLRRVRGLADFNTAVAAYFQERLPGVPLPPATDEQLSQVRARELVPEARVSALLERRVEVVRAAMNRQEGIPPERLVPGAPATAADAPGFGLVQFVIVAE